MTRIAGLTASKLTGLSWFDPSGSQHNSEQSCREPHWEPCADRAWGRGEVSVASFNAGDVSKRGADGRSNGPDNAFCKSHVKYHRADFTFKTGVAPYNPEAVRSQALQPSHNEEVVRSNAAVGPFDTKVGRSNAGIVCSDAGDGSSQSQSHVPARKLFARRQPLCAPTRKSFDQTSGSIAPKLEATAQTSESLTPTPQSHAPTRETSAHLQIPHCRTNLTMEFPGVADIIPGRGLHDAHDLLGDIDCRSACEDLAGSDNCRCHE
jgi:hypothetical protein